MQTNDHPLDAYQAAVSDYVRKMADTKHSPADVWSARQRVRATLDGYLDYLRRRAA